MTSVDAEGDAAENRGSGLDAMAERAYHELRGLARAALSRRLPGQTLQTTALVHEAYLRLAGRAPRDFADQGQFLLTAAGAIRDVLVERARRRCALKRGGGRLARPLDGDVKSALDASPEDLLVLEEEMAVLAKEDPMKHQLVQLRFYAGLTAEQTAAVLQQSSRTVERHWRYLRARLYRVLRGAPGGRPGDSA